MTVRDALNSALDEEMAADPKVFVMGEEVLKESSLNPKYSSLPCYLFSINIRVFPYMLAFLLLRTGW